MTEERTRRRLSAILAADVVGYSRLMRADEEGTLARLKAVRKDLIDPGLAGHGGRIVKLMGDGMLVEFGSVVDAVRSAAEVQTAVATRNSGLPADERIAFRVGVNLGDVVIDGDDIYGDGVNVAARLEALADPGGICISGAVYDQVRDRMDLPFDDMGEQKVKNIDRPVRAWRWLPDGGVAPGDGTPAETPLPLPKKPSIAVLPFDNMSDDPAQEYFADGITEDIITELSKFRTLFVIARNSSFAFKGQALDVKQIGSKLGVRYVVEGSVRRAGNRVRITAQLIDAAEDQHIWAQRYDRDLEDIFAVQDEVTRAVITAIEPQLAISERKRALRKTPESLDAWENYQRGLWHTFQYKPEDRDTTLGFFRRAIELDPTFASAHAGLGYALYVYIILGVSPDRAADLREAYEVSQTAVRLDEHDPFAWVALTRGHLLQGEHDASIVAADTAISLNPNFALAHFGRAHACWHSGRPGEAIASHDEAMRLSPHDPMMSAYMASKAIALLMLGEYEKAVALSRRSQQQANAAIFSHLAEISALGLLGRRDDARDAITRARQKKPDLSVGYVDEALPITDRQCRDLFLDGLRKAGLPD
jgi:adenylate cyclase